MEGSPDTQKTSESPVPPKGKSRKLKPNACSECHRLKKTCNYEAARKDPMTKSCDRCLRLRKECIPRVVFARGRPKKGDKRVPKSEEFEESRALEIVTAGLSEEMRNSIKTSKWWFHACQAVGATEETPLFLVYYVHFLFFLAKDLKSLVRLQNASAIAAMNKIKVDMEMFALEKFEPLPLEMVLPMQKYFRAKYMSPSLACVFSRINTGQRDLSVSKAFDFFLESRDTFMKTSCGRYQSPTIEIFSKFAPVEPVKRFVATGALNYLRVTAGTPLVIQEPLPHIDYGYISPEWVDIQDKFGNPFKVRLFQACALACKGRLGFLASGFIDFIPQNAAAEARYQEFCSTVSQSDSLEPFPTESQAADDEVASLMFQVFGDLQAQNEPLDQGFERQVNEIVYEFQSASGGEESAWHHDL